jgi:hypothetical protein
MTAKMAAAANSATKTGPPSRTPRNARVTIAATANTPRAVAATLTFVRLRFQRLDIRELSEER